MKQEKTENGMRLELTEEDEFIAIINQGEGTVIIRNGMSEIKTLGAIELMKSDILEDAQKSRIIGQISKRIEEIELSKLKPVGNA